MPDAQDLLTRSLESLSWMITDIKYRFNLNRQDDGIYGMNQTDGDYSPELKKAIELRMELEEYFKQGSGDAARTDNT